MTERTERDEYGIDRDEAVRILDQFLHETLHEPQAELDEVGLEDGKWQGRVRNSQRGISVVFLAQHNGVVAPGHMTADAHMDTIKKR